MKPAHGHPEGIWKGNGAEPQRQRSDGLGSGRPVAERAVTPEVGVLLPPPLRQDLGLGERVEELAVQELVAR